MTRINLVSPSELADQHLIAEYRELPRVIKGNYNIKNAPKEYVLGKGHVLWCKTHEKYLLKRYKQIIDEMIYRGFNTNYTYENLKDIFCNKNHVIDLKDDYIPNDRELNICKERIKQRYLLKPLFYKWTKRVKPSWL